MKPFPEVIRINEEYSFFLNALSVLPNNFDYKDPQISKIIETYVRDRKKLGFSGWGKKRNSLSIAPTGYCAGRCYGALDGKGCYAASFFNEKEYLTPDKLEKIIKEYDINLAEGGSIIYGGEPVINWEPFVALIKYLSPISNYVSIVTSTFYSETTFKKLAQLYQETPNFTICVSLDNKYDNNRLFPPLTPEQSHQVAYRRFKELYKIDPVRIAIRATIVNGNDYWSRYIREVENDIGGDVQHNCDWLTSGEYDEQKVDKFLQEFSDYVDYKDIQSPKYIYNNFRGFLAYDKFAGIIKGCDVNMSRIAVNHKGERICCVDDLFSTQISSWSEDQQREYIFNTSHEICKDCNAKNLCFSKCFYAFAKAPCHYNLGLFKKFLQWQAKRDFSKLIEMSVIQKV